MTRDEMKKILTPVLMNYSKEWESFNLSDLVDFWYGAFGDCDYDLVNKAFNAHMATSSFTPKIADINKQIQNMTNPVPMSETEAFGKIMKAIERSAWHSEEEFAKLDPILQKIVGDPQQLMDWSGMTVTDIECRVQPMITRDYRAEIQRQQEYAKLPEDVRARIDAVNNRPRLYEGRMITDESKTGTD